MNKDEIKDAFNAARISEATFKGYSDFLVQEDKNGGRFDGAELIKGIMGFTAVALSKIINGMDLDVVEYLEFKHDVIKNFSIMMDKAQSLDPDSEVPLH